MAKQESLFFDELAGADEPAEQSGQAKTKAAGRPRRRRKKANREVEDYYALLGVDAAADMPALKRAYIAKTKEFPPETHPEEFQKIRVAYDVLRDPERRKEYDILRQYGETVEDLLREATSKPTINRNTINLLKRAVDIDPDNRKARSALAFAYFATDRPQEAYGQFYHMRRRARPDELPKLWCDLVAMLVQTNRTAEALAEAKRFLATYPRAAAAAWDTLLEAYELAGREQELLADIEQLIRELTEPVVEDIALYSAWLSLAEALDQPAKAAKAEGAARKFIKSFGDATARSYIVDYLRQEYQDFYDNTDFAIAKRLVDLALVADKNNAELKQLSQRLQLLSGIGKEFERASSDDRLFSPVILDAMRWFHEEFDLLTDFKDSLLTMASEQYLSDTPMFNELYAAGIVYLKKKYPCLYRYYQERWQELFKQKTAGLNRDERRSLRL